MNINAQENLFDEIIVDNFAGGGGASTGIELALGRIVNIAINHDPDAILMHKTNHPHAIHLQASVWDVDPVEVCGGRPVGLAWFSPDCKHFSKAKGAALVDKHIRGLAWIVLRWAGTVRPRVIILENVEEFQTWGPVRKGKPIKKKAGQTFQRWLKQLRDLGYTVDYRELVAADYGAPTSRKRFVLIARCDGKPIVWPERTHAPAGSEEVKSGKCKPWRSAAEIIDWSIPMYSIFDSKQEIKSKYGVNAVRPLADNTLRRIIRGVDKFTIRSGKPFIVPTGYGERKGQTARVHDIDAPLPTVVSTCKQSACNPVFAPITFPNTCNSVGSPADKPVYTITSAGNQVLTSANLKAVDAPFIAQQKFKNAAQPITSPLTTITAVGAHELSSAQLIQYHTEQSEAARANSLREALPTVDASNRYGLISANLVEYFSTGRPIPVDDPLHTVTSHDREALTAAHIQKYYGGVVGADATEPLPTVTAIDHNSLCASHVVEFKGSDIGQDTRRPLRTVTTSAGEFGVAGCRITKYVPGINVGKWPQIRALLNKWCDYSLADDEILLISISGSWYFIADITLRMLTPRELYRAMGFPEDYIIDRDYMGNEYGKTKQVARCGNAVCPPMAKAVVQTNMPEYTIDGICTMQDLLKRVTA